MSNEKWMKVILFGLTVMVLTGLLTSCKNHKDPNKTESKFFIVRTAERHPGFNGHLTWYGRLRAAALMETLKDSGIQKIYVTPYSRTIETADSLILLQKTDTCVYRLDTTAAELLQQIKTNKDFGKTILIVSHGQMIPAIIRGLGGRYEAASFPDSVFNMLFEIINDHGKVEMHTLRYGRPNFSDLSDTLAH